MYVTWPKGFSVNNGDNRYVYLDTAYALNYPFIDNITASLCKVGPAALSSWLKNFSEVYRLNLPYYD